MDSSFHLSLGRYTKTMQDRRSSEKEWAKENFLSMKLPCPPQSISALTSTAPPSWMSSISRYTRGIHSGCGGWGVALVCVVGDRGTILAHVVRSRETALVYVIGVRRTALACAIRGHEATLAYVIEGWFEVPGEGL
jgi:hypothetical protein